ncbi:MAG: TonB-dependent receptor plug domain-containing protein, partial [Saprospiraceae bacterium]
LGETDVLKALLTLPGVSNTGEVGSGYNVRGGNIDQNLILQEGAFHLNPTHVLGLFSAFNPDAIKNVTLYKGYIPAQYGGRTSSVLNIKLKDPDYKKWSVFGGIGPISSKIFLEGPIIKDRTSFFIGSRFTYSDWVLKLVRDPNLKNSSAGFNDFNFKISHRLSTTGTIQVSAYQSNDRFNYAKEFGYGWNSKSVSLLYTQQFKNQIVLSGSLIYSDNNSNFNDQTALVKNNLENGLVYYKAKLNAGWQIFKTHTINAGIDGIRYKPKAQIFKAIADQEVTHEVINQSQGDEGALYINDEFSILPKLNASFGYRFNIYRNIGPEQVNEYELGKPRIPVYITGMLSYTQGEIIRKYHGAEPRASLAYILSDQSSLKLAYTRLYQFIHLVSNTASATPVDIWQLSNAFLAPQSANNFSLGYFKNLNQNEWETSFEVYYKKLENLVEYKDFARLLRNRHLETELFLVMGKSYGAEISVKRLKNNPTGYISYTLSRSLRKSPGLFPDEVINNGLWYPSNFDKPHNLNIVFDLQVRKTMFLSANFVYTTGRPQTTPIADFYLGDGGVFLNYSQRNSLRIPDYHRLDISYTITRGAIRTRKRKGSLTLAVYNLYARKNAFSVFYRRSPNQPLVGYKLAVLGTALPSITYNFQF